MFLGGLSVDLWRAVADRRELSSMADSAATAAANGVDIDALRAGTRAPRSRASRARSRWRCSMRIRTTRALDAVDIEVVGNRVTVTLRDHVRFSLLGIFMAGGQFDIRVHGGRRAPPEGA